MWLNIKKCFKILFLRISFLKKFHLKWFPFGVLVSALHRWLLTIVFRVNYISVHWYWNVSSGVPQIVCGMYPNWTYGFSPPACFWKVAARVPVGCSEFFAFIDCFAWSKISSKFFVQDFVCWFLNCVYLIYWISVHWYWKLSLGVLENCLWDVYKSDTQLRFPCRFVEGCGKGAGCVISLVVINGLTGFKSIIPSSSNWFWWLR